MTQEFESLENTEEMLRWLSDSVDDDEPEDAAADMLLLNMQMFAKVMPKYLALSPEMRKDIEDAVRIAGASGTNSVVRHTALLHIQEVLFPAEPSGKKITRKEKSSEVPCEDCENAPTHLVEFREGDRTEQHYLCEKCERTARE